MKRIAPLAIIAAAILAACGGSTTPDTPTESFIATSGSYLLHQNTMLTIDTVTNKVTETPAPSDSTIVGAAAVFNGKSSTPYVELIGSSATDTSHYYQEGGELYTALPLNYDIGGIPLDLGFKWAKIYDNSGTSWTGLADTITPVDLPIGGYKLSAKLNFLGQSAGTENLTINGTTVSVKKVKIDLNARLYAMAGPTSLPVDVNLVVYYWLADKIGVVKMEQPAAIINLGLLGQLMGSPIQAVPGMRSVTTKYVVR